MKPRERAKGISAPPRLRIETEVRQLKLSAPAKINLFLRILAQERSGFHQLETLFCRLEFGDTLELERASEGIGLDVEGAEIGPPEENLVYRAAQRFFEASGSREGARIRLRKRIPMGAGLGGGSSDAASTLLGLATLYPGTVDRPRLLEIAGTLGSDVPFFLSPSPLALAWGRGNRVQPMRPLPGATVVLALPPVEIPTAWAYGCLAKEREAEPVISRPHLLSPEPFSSWEAVAELVENDFESVVFREYPSLKRIRKALEDAGSLISLLSGSGSALFGVFGSRTVAEAAYGVLREEFPDTDFVLTRTEIHGRDPQNTEGVEPKVGL